MSIEASRKDNKRLVPQENRGNGDGKSRQRGKRVRREFGSRGNPDVKEGVRESKESAVFECYL